MTKIPRLTKESEERISAALSEVAALTNKGYAPNDAIVKVASTRKVPAGQVRLMVRAFNNGRSIGHLRTHDTLAEKAAAFELADASEILERMFPSEIETPAQQKAAAAIADDYKLSPRGWLRRRAEAITRTTLREKVASADNSQDMPSYPEEPHRAGKQAMSKLHDLRREHQRVKDAAMHACYKVAEDVNAVGDYFRRPDAQHPDEVGKNAELVLGASAGRLVKHAADMNKSVKYPPARGPHAVSWDEAPYSLIKTALHSMADFAKRRAELDAFEKELPEKRAETLAPFGLSPETDVITGSVWDNQSQTKQAVSLLGLGLAGAVGGSARGLANKMAPKTKEDLIQEKLQELGAPDHEDRLRAIRMQTMMHEMMASDPVISGYDPAAVMEAYNHLSEVAPKAMQQRVMAQALLRKYLEQASAIDPFDVDQMLDVEGKLTNRDMPQQLMANAAPGPARELGPPMSKPRGISESKPDKQNIVDDALKPSA